jgi:hypothetical protein
MVYADDIELSDTTVSGFGTLGAVYNSNEKYGFVRDVGQETAPGRQYSWRSDTRLGVQVGHTFSPQWQAVAQVLLRDQAENTLNNSISRAFVSYRPTANLHLRLGRMADATFLMSDYLDVGYVYPWVRPPMESYGIMAPRFYDGLDATYSIPGTVGNWRIKGLAGRVKAAMPTPLGENYMLESDDLKGLALIREQGPLKMRIGYISLHMKNPTIGGEQITLGLNQMIGIANAYSQPAIAAEALSLRENINSLQGSHIGYTSAGFSYDDGQWVVQGEINDLSSQSKLAPAGQMGYASVGYRKADFLPYMMISGSRSPAPVRAGTSWGPVLGSDAGNLQNGALTAMNASHLDQSTLSLGIRWDFDSRAALKLQWDHVRVRGHGWGGWTRPMADDGAAGSANVLSASIDFVF